MAALLAEHRLCVLSLTCIILFFLWMDITLYYKIQNIKPLIPLSLSSTTTPPVKSKESLHLFSPFKGLSIKMMMMDQFNNYIFTPLAEIFNEVTNLSKTSFISPNLISLIGVFWAFLAGKLITYDSFVVHRLSVFFFQIRTLCDALDGIVARDRLGIKKHISLSNTSGYIVDGVADTIGFIGYLIGCYIYLKRNLPKPRHHNHQYLPLQIQDGLSGTKVISNNVFNDYISSKLIWTTRQIFFVVLCFALQMGISCALWNRYIEAYHILLESPAKSMSLAIAQNEIQKSSILWVIMWFWRILNAQALMQMLLVAVFINRLWDFLTWIQYIGFAALFTLAFFTEIHINSISSMF